MANFVVILDSIPARCREYTRSVREHIAPFPGLKVETREGENWAVVWAAAHNAPVSVTQNAESAAFVWGMPLDDRGHVQTAVKVQAEWKNGNCAVWDGFYAGVVIEANGTLSVGADVLGLFPIYYWRGSGVVLVASSIEPITRHPAYTARLDTEGLIGILLTNGLLGGHTILENLKRLKPRHQLLVRDQQLSEAVAYQVPEIREFRSLPFKGHVELLTDAFRKAMRRHVCAVSECGLLLSGGLDSRLLAGALVEIGVPVRALTFGLPEENETKCARSVANTLEIQHTVADVPVSEFPEAAEAFAKWDCLSSGFSSIPDWTTVRKIAEFPSRVVLGHVLDGVAGGIHVGWAYDEQENAMTCAQFLRTLNRWGFPPETLRNLLQQQYRDLIDEVTIKFSKDYDSWSEQPHLRAWYADLHTRQRFHVGISLWITAFGSWPIAPTLDRELMAVSASLPGSSLADRRAQFGILSRMFPDLAVLNLDRNTNDNMPPDPRVRDYVTRYTKDKVLRALSIAGLQLENKEDQRFYDRLYNLNSPAWMNIRKMVEPYHQLLPSAIRRDAIANWLPPATRKLSFFDPISDPARIKILMGLAIVSRNHGL